MKKIIGIEELELLKNSDFHDLDHDYEFAEVRIRHPEIVDILDKTIDHSVLVERKKNTYISKVYDSNNNVLATYIYYESPNKIFGKIC